ncbi:MAG: hypothetical protein ABIO81_06235 [Ginsengibacter sp.]
MRYNPATLKKFENILDECGYIVRYERGSFQSGYCILEDKKVVVLNKFLTTEGRINTLMDLIPLVNINYEMLPTDLQKMYDDIIMKKESANKQL